MRVRDFWIYHEDGRIFARSWEPGGDGGSTRHPPVILLHDSLGCVDVWRDFPSVLSGRLGRTVIAYDRLGFGRSDARSGDLGLDFISDEAETYFPVVCEQMGVHDFVVFGHSVGGGMAVHCAASLPDRCERVVTESAQAFVEDRTLRGIAEAELRFREPGQLDRLARYHGDKARWVLDAWVSTWLDPAFRTWSLDDVLPRVHAPLMAIHGALDEYGSVAHPDRIVSLAGGPARSEVLPGVHHAPHREAGGQVVELCATFVGGAA